MWSDTFIGMQARAELDQLRRDGAIARRGDEARRYRACEEAERLARRNQPRAIASFPVPVLWTSE